MATEANIGRSQLVPNTINWKVETSVSQTKFTAHHDEASPLPKEKEREVLLTGATGFVGSHILATLIAHVDVAKIHCIAIPAGSHVQLSSNAKVVAYHGSLASLKFGLISREMVALKSKVDQIIHAGSQGHCLNNYASVRSSDYTPTQILADLAAPRKVPFHFISSPRVILLSGQHSALPEPVSTYSPPTDGS
jgi:aspyridone synthetase (hybrid polyketide synthase/nonribosomal peptide synthetase)